MIALALLAASTTLVPAVLTLETAESLALANHPQLAGSAAQAEAAGARVGEAKAGWWPQVSLTSSYQNTTANFVPRPGANPSSTLTSLPSPSFKTYSYWNNTLSASQLLWDFGQIHARIDAAEQNSDAASANLRAQRVAILAGVRAAFVAARGQRELVGVADKTLENMQKHEAQTAGFVTMSTRPPIDLVQAKYNVANARVAFVAAQSDAEVARAVLVQAMGVDEEAAFDVGDPMVQAMEGEDATLDSLLARARETRRDLATLHALTEAQHAVIRGVDDSRWPVLTATTNASLGGLSLADLGPNWNIGAQLSWPLFQGFITAATLREANAVLVQSEATSQLLERQIRRELRQAQTTVRSTKATVEATREADALAQERLNLADRRYAAGVGTMLEFADAQLAASSAAAQVVRAQCNLALARLELKRSLGLE